MGVFDFLKKDKKSPVSSSQVEDSKSTGIKADEDQSASGAQSDEDNIREIESEEELKGSGGDNYKEMMKDMDTSGLSMKEKMGLKMFKVMPKKKQQKIMQQAMNPQEVAKNKDKILKQVDDMVASGQIDKSQAEAVKSKLGLR